MGHPACSDFPWSGIWSIPKPPNQPCPTGVAMNWRKHPWSSISGDSWMYPYQRTPMGNLYISPIYPYIVGVYGLWSPRIPIFSPYKYHGVHVRERATPVLVPWQLPVYLWEVHIKRKEKFVNFFLPSINFWCLAYVKFQGICILGYESPLGFTIHHCLWV